ncbi:hypothetical protein A9C19_02510 [Bacillus weihaiensis]|uniref:Uncharacterized protein n=1 Tax=Bacillus weihaiensis TaxID=1547283 RepID=A0A1L3MN32_9BACI|nr:hypothetical protein A9C19_02510 [Bacillus weihaiensis]
MGFLSILLLVFSINLIYFTNIVFIDMPWKELTTLPFINSILLVLCIGIICFFYIKNLTGNRTYKKIKEAILGTLFGVNTLSCVLWLSLSYSHIPSDSFILLISVIFVSAALTVQVTRRSQKNK